MPPPRSGCAGRAPSLASDAWQTGPRSRGSKPSAPNESPPSCERASALPRPRSARSGAGARAARRRRRRDRVAARGHEPLCDVSEEYDVISRPPPNRRGHEPHRRLRHPPRLLAPRVSEAVRHRARPRCGLTALRRPTPRGERQPETCCRCRPCSPLRCGRRGRGRCRAPVFKRPNAVKLLHTWLTSAGAQGDMTPPIPPGLENRPPEEAILLSTKKEIF